MPGAVGWVSTYTYFVFVSVSGFSEYLNIIFKNYMSVIHEFNLMRKIQSIVKSLKKGPLLLPIPSHFSEIVIADGSLSVHVELFLRLLCVCL